MKEKLILKEDLDLELPSYEGLSIEDIYDEQGIDVFSEENIPLLKQAGLINDDGYPIEEYTNWNDVVEKRPMDIQELYNLDSQFIESQYVRDLMLKEIYKHTNDLNEIKINYVDKDLPSIRDISKDFIEGCFSGDVWDFFSGYGDYTFSDCKWQLDSIPDEVLDVLEQKGFPRDIYNQLMDGTADEDSPVAEWYDSLKGALVIAYTEAEENGSAIAAENDFNEAFRDSMPEGVAWVEQESTESTRPLIVSKDFIENNLEGIWDFLNYYSFDSYDAFVDYLKQTIGDNLAANFREPYYGWQDFDEDSFADRLLDEIMELDIPEPSLVDFEAEEEERSLLDFDGETGEYHEDLDLDVSIPAKPNKLFYKYKEYNSELSAKAYMLDAYRLELLIDYLNKPGHGWDFGPFEKDFLKDCLDNALETGENTGIILSSIKPSYVINDFEGYGVWNNQYDYYTEFLGRIPKHVGDEILNKGKLSEDIEIDIVPIPDIDVGPSEFTSGHDYDELIYIIEHKYAEDNWVLQTYDAEYKEYNTDYNFGNLPEIYDKYSNWKSSNKEDKAMILYVPNPDKDVELDDGSYVICGKFGEEK